MTDTATRTEKVEAHGRRSFTFRPGTILEKFGLPLLLVAIVIFFSAHATTGDLFRSQANLTNIFANQSVTGLIAIGMVIPLVAGFMDLSVAAIAGVANVAVAAAISYHDWPLLPAIALGLGVGVGIGAVNGFLVSVLRLNAFICTFGTYTFLLGLLQFYTEGKTISSGLPPEFGAWGSAKFLGIAQPFWLLIVVAAVAWYLLTQTPFGRKLTAIGSNETAARLAGIRVDRSVFLTFVLSGLLAGIAGVLLTSRSGGGDATTAASFLFPAFAAVFLGQTAIRPGFYNVWGTVFGVFLVAVAVNGLIFLGAESWVTQMFNGLALVASLAISSFSARIRDARAKDALRNSD